MLEPEGIDPKEWQFSFKVGTKDRSYTLFAPTKAEKEMWVHAFNTILKYKRKAEEMKHHGLTEPKRPNQELEMGMENEGFDEAEGEEEEHEEEPERRDPRRIRDEGDYMEDNGRRLRVAGKQQHYESSEEDEELKEQPRRQHEVDNRQRRREDEQPRKHPVEVDSEEEEEKAHKKVNQRVQMEKQRQREAIVKQQAEEEEAMRQRMQPVSRKRRDSPEVIEDDIDSADEEYEKENLRESKHEPQPKERSKAKDKQSDRRRERDEIEDINIDVDRIIKSGPKETIKLEPPSPPRKEEKESDEPPPYFTGFTNNSKRMQKQPDAKPKPVIKPKNIVRTNADKDEDLLSRWDKKYGTATTEKKNEWGMESKLQKESQSAMIPKSKNFEPDSGKKKYVENVLANQAKTNGDDFEENWDDEDDGSPVETKVDSTQYLSKHKPRHSGHEDEYDVNYKHPDIIADDSRASKAKKKKKGKKKTYKSKEVKSMDPQNAGTGAAQDFDMNWDDE